MVRYELSTDKKPRCWACGRLLKPVDVFGDLCNKCSTLKPDPNKVQSSPLKDKNK